MLFLYYREKRILSIDELVPDIFHYFLCVTGIYIGFLIIYYGIFRELYPGTDINVIYSTFILGGVVIILMSGKSALERILQ